MVILLFWYKFAELYLPVGCAERGWSGLALRVNP
jgi:hypothetical protein